MICEFDDDFILSIQKQYQVDGNSQILNNRRFYLVGIWLRNTDFYLCIPLHSNSRNFILLTTPNSSNHWKSHGLNLDKMLLLTKEEILTYSKMSSISNKVWIDINGKIELIEKRVKYYLLDFLNYSQARSRNILLTKQQINFLKYSSLNHFERHLTELEESMRSNHDLMYVKSLHQNSMI